MPWVVPQFDYVKSRLVPYTLILVAAALLAAPACGAPDKALPREPTARKTPSLAKPAQPATLTLDDRPQPLSPTQLPSRQEQDRMEALALFSTGRVLEQREDYVKALRNYQRAFRCDPTSGDILEGIIDTASELHREAEVTRYARRAVDVQSGDVLLRLAMRLTEQGDWDIAVPVYEKVLKARANEPLSAADVVVRLELGKLYQLLGKYSQGADCFQLVQKALANPQDYGITEKFRRELLGDAAALYNVIGECNLLAGRTKAARAAFEKAHAAAPDKALLGFNLARVELREKHPAQALASVQAYFDAKLCKEEMLPYRVLSDALAALGRQGELLGRLEKLHAEDPANVSLAFFLGAEYARAKQFDKAQSLFQTLLKKNPSPFGFDGLIDLDRQTKRIDALLAVLAEAAEKLDSLEPLADRLKDVAGDAPLFQQLVEAARNEHRADPKKPEYGARLVLALLALQRKQYDVAGEFYHLAADARPERRGEILLEWGLSLLAADKRTDAVKAFRDALEKASPETQALISYYLVGALAADKHYEEALQLVRKAQQQAKDKDASRLIVREGWVLSLDKRPEEARKKLLPLVTRLDGDYHSPEVRLVVREAKLLLSNLDVQAKQTAQAEEWLEEVLDEFPDDPGALNDLGYLWAERGVHLERALRMVQRAVESEPDNGAYRDSLGWAHYQLGNYRQAVVELEKAVAAEEPEGLELEHLGDACQKAGEPAKARTAWQRAVKKLREEGETEKLHEVELKLKAKSNP